MMFCTRCKRDSHNKSDCHARTFKDGNQIGSGSSQGKYKKKPYKPNRRY